MRPLPIELWTRSRVTRSHGALLLLILIALTAAVGVMAAQRWDRAQQLEAEWERAQAEVRRLQRQSAAERAAVEQSKLALASSLGPQSQRWAGVRAFPWDEVLLSVERSVSPEIRLRAMTLDAEAGQVRLQLRAANEAAVHELLSNLNAGGGSTHWMPRRMEKKSESAAGGNGQLVEAELHLTTGR